MLLITIFPLRYGIQIHYLLEEAHRWLRLMTLFNFHPHSFFKLPTLPSSLLLCHPRVSSTRILHQSLQGFFHFNQSCYKNRSSPLSWVGGVVTCGMQRHCTPVMTSPNIPIIGTNNSKCLLHTHTHTHTPTGESQ